MAPLALTVLFLASIALALGASEVLVRGLDRLGAQLHLQEGLLGLLTAIGADAPEVSSALLAVSAGHGDLGLGVVFGSNVFNLAALLGLGAVVAGHVRVRRIGLGLNGGVVLATTLLVAGLMIGILSPPVTIALVVLVFVPYLIVLSLHPHQVAHLPLPGMVARLLATAVREISHEERGLHAGATAEPAVRQGSGQWWRPLILIVPALVVIILASEGMVTAALGLALRWRLPNQLVGAVVLAGLTSLPNAYAAVRLALQQRGSAVVSEAFNSNTINLVAGICLPALFVNVAGAGPAERFDLFWLLAMTLVTIILLTRRRGLNRPGGILVIGLYVLFVLFAVRG